VREVVQGSGGANDENAWMCIDGPKREGRTRQNGKVEEWRKRKRKKEMDSKQIFLVGEQEKGAEEDGWLLIFFRCVSN